jgi:SAM-dependent methyltransferase
VSCHACGGGGLRPFFSVSDIPVHSCLLMGSREEALAWPRGDLRLALCLRCGFVQNERFEPRLQAYSARYEETQGFSPTFGGFADALARGLVERHGLVGRDVLEIGCGKGEFLARLLELGAARGVGIDPAFVPGRLESPAAGRLQVVRHLFGEDWTHLEGDLVCCRHTLEHVQPVRRFLDQVRRSAARRPGAVLFLEVPDLRRVLREGAFWDVYYEHCSYFGAGALGRLLRAAGFEILDLWRDFGDQYLCVEARLADAPRRTPSPLEEDLAALRGDVARFEVLVRAAQAAWRSALAAWHRSARRVALWGGGSKAVAFLTTLGAGDAVDCVVDVNPHKQGRFVPGSGHAVLAPAALRERRPDVVVAMNPIYRGEIERALRALGLVVPVLALGEQPDSRTLAFRAQRAAVA